MSDDADLSELIKGIENGAKRVMDEALVAVDLFAEVPLISDAQELTPIESGFLKDSANTGDPAKVEGDTIVKFLGFNADYAGPRHDGLPVEDAGEKVNPLGQNKFLTESLKRNADKFAPYVAGRIRDALGN